MEKVINVKEHSWVRGNCIGQGSFGTVSLAVDKSNGHVFSVKSVEKTSYLMSQIAALDNEIRVLKSLSSPYVVNYLGDDVTASYRNLHMEYMPGGTAADLANKYSGGDVDEGIIRSVTFCIVSALRYVHSKGIVHCDVKGRNVLVGSTPDTAKLADFGSAVELTEEMRPRGSPLWMAPEVLRGEYQGPESDVWSLGCTLIEMVTGKPAWEDNGSHTMCRIGYSDELPEFPTQLSELGRDFLSRCLRKDRAERWRCDQLLQHPFLLSSCPSGKVTEWSPRCILDWFDSNFSDEDNDDQRSCDVEDLNFDAKKRIKELASNSGAIWEESDGWVTVRTFTSEKEDVHCGGGGGGGGGGKEGERTNLEYPDLIEEITYENSDSIAIGEVSGKAYWEYYDSNDALLISDLDYSNNYCSSKAGSSCQNEFQNDNYSCCNLISLSLCYYCCYYYKYCKRGLSYIQYYYDFVINVLCWNSVHTRDQFLTFSYCIAVNKVLTQWLKLRL